MIRKGLSLKFEWNKDRVRISKSKKSFAKGCVANCLGEVFMIHKIKNTVPLTCLIHDLKGQKNVGAF